MEMYILLFLLSTISTVNSLMCYECRSFSKANCAEKQTLTSCNDKHHDVCYVLKYSIKLSETNSSSVVHHGSRKGCTDSVKGCQSFCKSLFHRGYKDCKAECCFGNKCNKEIVVTDNWKNRMKRQFSNANSVNQNSIVFLLTISLFVTALIYT